jgi:O-antigen/teichoic acid export membrane protein
MTSKRQKLARNSIYSLFTWFVPIVPSFLVTPILIGHLGNELYGLYVIFLGFLGYFFTLNIGKTVTKFVAEYRASGETGKISETVTTTLIMGSAVGIIATGAIALSARGFVIEILRVPEHLQDVAVTVLYLSCANILVLMLGLTFQFILQGLQRFDLFMLVANGNSVTFVLGSLALVLLGYGPIGLLTLSLVVSLVTGSIAAVLVKRELPELTFAFSISSSAWTDVWRYGFSIMGYHLAGSLLLLFERAWITRQFGPGALAFYVVPMILALFLQSFISSLVLAIFPVINEHLAEKQLLINLYKKVSRIVFTIIGFTWVTALVCGRDFLALWLNEEYAAESYHLLLIHISIVSLVALTMISYQLAEAFRAAPLTAASNFLWMAIAIPAMVIFSGLWMVGGVAYGRLLGVLVYIPFIIFVEKKFLGRFHWDLWLSTGLWVLAIAAIAGGVEYLVLSISAVSWPLLLAATACGGAIFAALLIVTGFIEPEEKLMIRNAIFRDR